MRLSLYTRMLLYAKQQITQFTPHIRDNVKHRSEDAERCDFYFPDSSV